MNFEKAKNTYRKNAIIQKQMADKLVSTLIKARGSDFEKIFEIGAGTGFLTECIKKNLNFKEIYLNDLTDNFTGIEPNCYFKGNILDVEMPNNLDLILSNAVFQWIEDYDKLFLKLNRSLKNKGAVCFSCFGKKNFVQFKELAGIGLNYPKLDNVALKFGFRVIYYEEELSTVYFKDIFELLNHIKQTGVKIENKSWTKSSFMDFREKYLSEYSDTNGLALTYHPIYYVLEKSSDII